MRRTRSSVLAAGLYLLVAVLVFGRQAVLHPATVVIAPNEVDSSQYQWFLAWWPHAILHGLNPFITHVVYVPDGYNLTWTTSLAGPALLLAPVTLLFGATVSFNLFSLLAATLSALAVYALCRRLTGSFWPALIAGLAFELSGYTLTAMQSDPWLTFVALVPVAVLLVVRHLAGEIGPRRFVVLLALAIWLQFLTCTEILATTTLFALVAFALGWWLYPRHRAALRGLVRPVALAGLIAVVLLSPYLLFMLHSHPVPNQALIFAHAPTDPTSLWVPGQAQARGPWQAAQWHKLGLPPNGNGFAFLGLPLLAIVVAFALRWWRESLARLLVLLFAITALALFGLKLTIAGHATGVPLPWTLIHRLPLLRYALPLRLGLYPALVAAVILAIWLARTRTAWRWAGAALALLALAPSLSAPVWHSDTSDPAFFADGTYRSYLRPTDNVLTIPATGPNERWQERAGFGFRIVGGYLGAFPPSYTRYAAWNALLNGRAGPDWPAELRRYLVAKRVTVILVDARLGPTWPTLFAPLAIRPRMVDGVLLYRLHPAV